MDETFTPMSDGLLFANWFSRTADRVRGPRAAFIADADRWADLWEDTQPVLYCATSGGGRVHGIPPWEEYDPCALPMFAVWPAIDRVLAAWRRVCALPTQAKHRCRLAAYAIRYGEQERW